MKSWAIAGAILLSGELSAVIAAEPSLIGAWQLDPAASGQSGLYIFPSTRYSMVLAGTERPDIADDLITIHPLAAKSSVVMKPGATEAWRFHIEGNTTALQQARNARGVTVQSADVRKFIRVE